MTRGDASTNGRVAIVKSAGRADAFADAVRGLGLTPVLVSPFQVEEHEAAHHEMCAALTGRVAWLAVTSPHAAVGVLALFAMEPFRVAAVGRGTASALQALDFDVDVVGDAGADALGWKIVAAGLKPGETVVHACGEDARPDLRRVVEGAGAVYLPVVVYRMVPDPVGERAASGEFDAVVIGSPNLAQRAAQLFPSHPPAVAIGRTTASALRELGWPPAAVAALPTADDVAAALAHALRREA
jgi:uroporphyrinogen-III synthase